MIKIQVNRLFREAFWISKAMAGIFLRKLCDTASRLHGFFHRGGRVIRGTRASGTLAKINRHDKTMIPGVLDRFKLTLSNVYRKPLAQARCRFRGRRPVFACLRQSKLHRFSELRIV